ncbi:MAG: glycogen-binding domain-containing protein [Gemmatimonadales bacterium]
MTARSWSAAFALAAGLAPVGFPAVAQTEGAVAVGASIVEYDGFLASGAVVLAPTLRFASPRLALAGQGSWTLFESGNQILQATAAGAWLANSSGAWRLELSGAAGASQYASASAAGHLLSGARLHLFGASAGGWVGAGIGQSFGGGDGVPVELVAAGWTVKDRIAWVGTATATLHDDVRHLDLLGALRWSGARLAVEARVGARPWARGPVDELIGPPFTGFYGEITADVPVTRQLSVSVSGGKYPGDPVRQTLGAEYVSAGLRLRAFGRPSPSVPLHITGVSGRRLAPPGEEGPMIAIDGPPGRRTIRILASGARVVELMGDFTDWTPVSMVEVRPGRWEVTLPLPPGLHRVNVRLDGGEWRSPGGLRTERTEFGGTVGILVLPR